MLFKVFPPVYISTVGLTIYIVLYLCQNLIFTENQCYSSGEER